MQFLECGDLIDFVQLFKMNVVTWEADTIRLWFSCNMVS